MIRSLGSNLIGIRSSGICLTLALAHSGAGMSAPSHRAPGTGYRVPGTGETTQQRNRYVPRCPEQTLLYTTLAAHLEAFLAQRGDHLLPRFVTRELRAFLECGILAYGFLRVRCPACREERLVPFSRK